MINNRSILSRKKLKPEKNVEQFYKLQKQDIDEMNLLNDDLKYLNCFVCNSDKFNTFGVKSGFEINKCKTCGMVLVNKRPSTEKLKEYYKNSKASKYFQKFIIEPSKEYRFEKIIKPRMEYINSFFKNFGEWLDIGCSTGTLIELGMHHGWKASGIEFEGSAINQCKEKNIKIYTDTIENLNISNKFDLITIFEVIEHTFNPLHMLKACYKANNPGGFLILTTPNISGIEFSVAGLSHSNICPPNHINYFSIDTISLLLEKVGYQIIDISTPGLLDVDNIRTFFSKKSNLTTGNKMLDEIIKSNEKNSIFLRDELQKLIINSKASGNLRVVVKKV